MGVANGMSQYWLKKRLLSHCRALETLNRWNMQGAIFGHVSCLVVFAQVSWCEVIGRQILDMHLRFRIPSKSRAFVMWHSSTVLCVFLFSGVHLFLICDRIEAARNIKA